MAIFNSYVSLPGRFFMIEVLGTRGLGWIDQVFSTEVWPEISRGGGALQCPDGKPLVKPCFFPSVWSHLTMENWEFETMKSIENWEFDPVIFVVLPPVIFVVLPSSHGYRMCGFGSLDPARKNQWQRGFGATMRSLRIGWDLHTGRGFGWFLAGWWWLEPWNFEWLSIQLGIESSSQLTNSYFSEGLVYHRPVGHQRCWRNACCIWSDLTGGWPRHHNE